MEYDSCSYFYSLVTVILVWPLELRTYYNTRYRGGGIGNQTSESHQNNNIYTLVTQTRLTTVGPC